MKYDLLVSALSVYLGEKLGFTGEEAHLIQDVGDLGTDLETARSQAIYFSKIEGLEDIPDLVEQVIALIDSSEGKEAKSVISEIEKKIEEAGVLE